MKIILMFLLFALSEPVFGQSEIVNPDSSEQLPALLKACSYTNVSRVEIYYFPEDIELEFGMSPEDLEHGFWAKTTISNFGESHFKSDFLDRLGKSKIESRIGGPKDLRWGCVFFDSDKHRIVALYFDKFGNGQVNGIQLKSNGSLLNLLRQRFSCR